MKEQDYNKHDDYQCDEYDNNSPPVAVEQRRNSFNRIMIKHTHDIYMYVVS